LNGYGYNVVSMGPSEDTSEAGEVELETGEVELEAS
jgi:hypothetical protein